MSPCRPKSGDVASAVPWWLLSRNFPERLPWGAQPRLPCNAQSLVEEIVVLSLSEVTLIGHSADARSGDHSTVRRVLQNAMSVTAAT